MHSRINYAPLNKLDKTCICGSNAIDSVAVLEGLMDFIEGSLLVSDNEIVNTDNRVCVIDINLEDYFNEEFSYWNAANNVILDPSKKSHRIKFLEELENLLNQHQFENTLLNCSYLTHQ